jgi:hypothetical protein
MSIWILNEHDIIEVGCWDTGERHIERNICVRKAIIDGIDGI